MSNTKIATLEPTAVWSFFDQILQIPRPSGAEEAINKFLIDFARKKKFAYEQDDAGNILIIKPATAGYEDAPALVLQSHMDMVAEKVGTSTHNFATDPIEAYVDGEWVTANQTTLGADNGIGMAAQLAVLDSVDLPHPRIEALFTSDEEVGLSGAFGLKEKWLTGANMMNLDSGEEGIIYVGCAGGGNTTARLSAHFEQAPAGLFFCKLSVSNLNGGHSGCDIHLGYANAIKLLARYLNELRQRHPIYISEIDGGNLSNAIPREASATIAVPYAEKERIRIALNVMLAELDEELHPLDRKLCITLESTSEKEKVIDPDVTNRLLDMLIALPHGAVAMSQQLPNLVETSNNIASLKQSADGTLTVTTSQRSSVASKMRDITHTISTIMRLTGAEVTNREGYPGWTPNLSSPLLQKTLESYRSCFGEEAEVKSIHAGLECGLIAKKYPSMQIISFGPTMIDIHSPNERLHIASVERWWLHMSEIISSLR